MSKKKLIVITFVISCMVVSFSILQRKIGQGLAYGYGYGYNSSVISVDPLTTTNKSPIVTGAYTGGPYVSIYVTIFDKNGMQAMAGTNAVDNQDGTWTLPEGSISPELEVGTYNVSAMVTNTYGDTTYDGTQNELKIIADYSGAGVDASLDGSRVKLRFTSPRGTLEYIVSKKKDFEGSSWKTITDSITLKLGENEGKRTYYVKFRDESGTESQVFKDSVDYTPTRYIKNSKSSVKRGQNLVQSGKKFSKNSEVLLYFSNSKGGYYEPVKMTTDSKGSFKTTYLVKKPSGKYKWYAVDVKTGKKSDKITYMVKK